MSSRITASQPAMASTSDFRQLEEALAGELVDTLCREHDREVQALYQEEVELRSELQRIVELMTNEILPRERQMHDMIEKMQEAYEKATRTMHAEMSKMQGGGLSAEQHAQRQGLLDPLAEMEAEITRIKTLLSHKVVQPDIQGWQAPAVSPALAPARAPAWTPARTPARTPATSFVAGAPARTPATSLVAGTPARTPATSLFDRIDVDNDGVITRTELANAVEASAGPSPTYVVSQRRLVV